MPTWSDAQKTAIQTHDRPVAVVAGAGSGKTFVLVERYLALLATHEVSQVVAITFTNKAAREMRNRARDGVIARATDANATERALWERRLAAIDSARIETIHALCGGILRANAAEARVDPDFETLEDDDARLLQADALDAALKAMQREHDPALALFAEYGDQRTRAALLDGITGAPLQLPDDLMAHWLALWEADATPLLRPLIDAGINAEIDSLFFAQPLPADDAFAALITAQMAHIGAIQTLDPAQIMGYWRALYPLSKLPLNKGNQKNWGKDRINAIRDLIRRLREALIELEPPDSPNDARAAELLPLWARALDRVRDAYAAMKSARAALDFDDLEQGTRALLTENAAVRARYRTEFKHLLVDEFQDTNRAQWDIVRALLPDDARGLFVVGDPKQSIYAFRGADVTVFEAARATVTAANGDIVALSESYRTHKHLIDLFNELFGQLLVRATPDALYQVEYGDRMTAFRPTTGEPPHVYLDLGVHPHRGDGTDDERAANHRRREAARIAAWIGARIAEARPIYDKAGRAYRPIQYGDFAVLFRRMTNVTLYEEAFKAAGLPYVTVAGRGFYDRQEVWDILNLLRALVNPADELALATALRSPLFNLSDEALFALRLAARDEPPVSLWDALGSPPSLLPDSERETVAFAAACLRDLRATAGRVTIAELLGDLMARTGYLATLTALPDGGRRRGNVEKLIAKARDGGRITLGSFTRYLQDLSARELREGEAALDVSGAIQLMTIHASKGLEFPAVVLADSGAKVGGRDDALLSVDPPACRVYDDAESKIVTTGALQMAKVRLEAREDAESRRLLYVAATRAADMLLISGQTTQGKDGALSPTGWLAWLCAALALDTLALDAPLALDGRWAGVVVSGYDAERDAPLEAQSLQLKPAETQISIQPTLMGLKSLAGLAAPPALLAPVKLRRTAMARALTATQIADLGCAFDIEDERERAYYRERWRRAVLRDAPSRIDTIQGTGRRYNARVLGEIVHRALRWWRKNTTRTEWAAALDAYAWDEGVIDADARDDLVNKAWTLLQNVTSTPLHQRIERAQQVYREVPFIYRTDQRQITGVIDVLLLTAENRWQIVDYKTASVPNWIAFEQHARRYHIQVGVYAAAALQLLDPSGTVAKVPVEVYIHYIRYATTVKIETGAWQGALTRLEPCIGELINEDG